MAGPKASRYCPECGVRVTAQPEVFDAPRKCPKCSQAVSFIKLVDAPPEPVVLESPDPAKSPLHYVAYCAIGVGFCSGLGALGGEDFLAFLMLILGVIPITAYCLSRAEYQRNRKAAAFYKFQAEHLAERGGDAVRKWNDFKEQYDAEISQARSELHREVREERAESERLAGFARERDKTIDRLGARLLKDTNKWVSSKLTGKNYMTQRDRLSKLIAFCRKHDYQVPDDVEGELFRELKAEYEGVLRKEHEKAEQQRIKAQIREEQRAERELAQEMQRMEAEQAAIQQALSKALSQAADEHDAEVEALRQKLREAEERSQRAKSMAQLTRAGHIYVISNVGAFGDGVYKVGMTRRLEPMDRVKELGDASVPFPFDVHMMISCDDAPKLEKTLHHALHTHRLNRINLRKEFFRVSIETIYHLVVENHGEVEYEATPEALEYHETLAMSDDDFADLSATQSAVGVIDTEEWE